MIKLKIAMIGLGSIGKRHLRNVRAVLEKRNVKYEIEALRSGHGKKDEELDSILHRQYSSVDEMPEDYDIIFVTNPTSLHYETIKSVIHKTKHMFIEKPIFEKCDYDIAAVLKNRKQESIYYVACPLRHKAILKFLSEQIVNSEKIIMARIISTSYLPDWRKGVDYRTVYSAQKKLGGGVSRDLIHEWDYAIRLFGFPEEVIQLAGHVSDLEMDCEDVSLYLAKYPKMLLELHLDYFGQKTERILQLFTNKERMDVDLIKNVITTYKNNEIVDKMEFPEEDLYLNEMEYFMDCVEGKVENINTIEHAYQTLKIATIGEGD